MTSTCTVSASSNHETHLDAGVMNKPEDPNSRVNGNGKNGLDSTEATTSVGTGSASGTFELEEQDDNIGQSFLTVPWAKADDPEVQAAYNFDDKAAFLELAQGRRREVSLAKADLFWDQCDDLNAQLMSDSSLISERMAALPKLQSLQSSPLAKEIFQPTDFRLLSKLGQGGYGCVYKALHLSTGHIVALKELTGSTSEVELKVHRTLPWDCGVLPCYGTFRAVSHSLDDTEESEEDHDKITAVTTKETAALAKDKTKLKTWLILQFGKGGSLVDRLLGDKGALTEKEAARMLKRLTKTLLFLKHKYGIVHNDIKPANVLLLDSSDPGNVVLCDLGAAAIGLWQKDRLGGTFSYMPPEKLRARKLVGFLTHYCNHEKHDVWALGVLLFASLYLKHPFNCKDLAKCTTITSSGDDAAKFYDLMETNYDTIQYPPTAPGEKPRSPDLETLLQGMLKPFCLERMSLESVKESSWVKRKGGKVIYPVALMNTLQSVLRFSKFDSNHNRRHHTEDQAVSKVLFESTINSLSAPSN